MGTCERARPFWLRPHFMEAENLLRFDRFMELCLYDVEHGYYAKNITSVGSSGDFSTTPSLSPVLAIALSKAIMASGLRDVIEIGPGAGDLSVVPVQPLEAGLVSFRVPSVLLLEHQCLLGCCPHVSPQSCPLWPIQRSSLFLFGPTAHCPSGCTHQISHELRGPPGALQVLKIGFC